MFMKNAEDAAWFRICELATAIKSEYMIQKDRDVTLVDKWAQEITWQCSIIDAFKEEDKEDKEDKHD